MLEKIHKSHLGIAASIWKAHDIMYWPNMAKNITSYVWSCTTCGEFSDAQQKQPLQTSTVPWSRIAVDLFIFNKKYYMITVAVFSIWKSLRLLQKSLHQDRGLCYLHLFVFFLIHTLSSSAEKQKVVLIAILLSKLDHKPLFNHICYKNILVWGLG